MKKNNNKKEIELIKENIFEDDLSSLSFGIFSNKNFSNNLNVNVKITFNDSYGNNSK